LLSEELRRCSDADFSETEWELLDRDFDWDFDLDFDLGFSFTIVIVLYCI